MAQPIEPSIGNIAYIAIISLSTAVIAPALFKSLDSLNLPFISPISGSLYMALTQIHPSQGVGTIQPITSTGTVGVAA
jgi:hypothetical protein